MVLPPSAAAQPLPPAGPSPIAAPFIVGSRVENDMLIVSIPSNRAVGFVENGGPAVFIEEIKGGKQLEGQRVDEYRIKFGQTFTPSTTEDFLLVQVMVDGKIYVIGNPWKEPNQKSEETGTNPSKLDSDKPPTKDKLNANTVPPKQGEVLQKESGPETKLQIESPSKEPRTAPATGNPASSGGDSDRPPVKVEHEPSPPRKAETTKTASEPEKMTTAQEIGALITDETTNERLSRVHEICTNLLTGGATVCTQINVNDKNAFHSFHFWPSTRNGEMQLIITTVNVERGESTRSEMDSLILRRKVGEKNWRVVAGELTTVTTNGEERRPLTPEELIETSKTWKNNNGGRYLDLKLAWATEPHGLEIVAGTYDRGKILILAKD